MLSFEQKERALTGLRKIRKIGGSVRHDTPPGSLADVMDRAARGFHFEFSMAEFLVEFHSDGDFMRRRRRIADEPHLAPNPVPNAFMGAAGEYLAKLFHLGEVPAWTMRRERFLDTPVALDGRSDVHDLVAVSPSAFVRRNLFVRCAPLGRSDLVDLYKFEYEPISMAPS